MLPKRLNKKGDTTILELIVKLIPQLIIFVILLGVSIMIYNSWLTKEEYSAIQANYKLVSSELLHMVNEDTRINIPVMSNEGTAFKFIIYQQGEEKEKDCNKQKCFCIYYFKNQDPNTAPDNKECIILNKLPIEQDSCSFVKGKGQTVTLVKHDNKIYLEGNDC